MFLFIPFIWKTQTGLSSLFLASSNKTCSREQSEQGDAGTQQKDLETQESGSWRQSRCTGQAAASACFCLPQDQTPLSEAKQGGILQLAFTVAKFYSFILLFSKTSKTTTNSLKYFRNKYDTIIC